MQEIMLYFVPIVLASSLIISKIFRRLKLPPVIGEITTGIILGVSILQTLISDPLALTIIEFLSELGIIFLLFLAGLEIDIQKIKAHSKDSILIAFSAALLPLFLGFFAMQALGYSFLSSLVFGGAIAVTSEGTKVKVLMDMNQLDTPLGAIMISAGAIDDIFEVLFLSIVIIFSGGGTVFDLLRLPFELGIFFVLSFLFFKGASKLFNHGKHDYTEIDLFSITLIFVLSLASISQLLGLGFLLGGIIGGFLLQIALRDNHHYQEFMIKEIKLITMALIVPFFFVNIGLNFDLTTLFSNIPLASITVIIAILGKVLGTLIIKPWTKLSLKQLYYLGWAMNSRGATELVIALIAMQNGLIPLEMFSALVATSIITTMIFPPILTRGITKNQNIMVLVH